ncbi:vWA domain-containing protein [Haloglomus halophilum]|uniref:vWA domain-containing protein n=1 Tax=Haloglomus halophilum TaxID=2962672 RepID=UPI0020C9AB4F|nr:VWA domain-containing protein [Haloglomus halophilum]
MYLTPDTDPDRLSRLALPDRRSAENRRELERLANICTPRSVDVSVSFTEREASCRPADSGDDGDDGSRSGQRAGAKHRQRRGSSAGPLVTESYVIRLPTERIEQGRTDMHPRRWDRRVQVGLLFHELGHVLYSDLQRFGEWRSHIAPEWEELFRTVYNAAEDGVVEAQMAAEFDVGEDFVVLNDAFAQRELRRHRAYADLFDDGGETAGARSGADGERARETNARSGGSPLTPSTPGPTPGPGAPGAARPDGPPLEYTVKEALGIGLLDHGFGDSGRFEALLDPADERLAVRNDRHDVLAELRPAIGEYMDRMFAEPDGTRRVDLAAAFFRTVRPTLEPLPPAQLQAGQRRAGRPHDAIPVAITDPRPADRLPGLAVGQGEDGGRRSGDRTGRGTGPGREVLPGRLDRGTVRRAERSIRGDDASRALDDSDPLRQEAERLLELVRESEELDRVGIPEPEPGSGDRERWETAARDAQRLSAALETQLRRERRATRSGGHRVGSLDSRRVVDVRRGSSRVFERVERGPEKDYSCLLVLDRSGSMSGAVEAAEDATARLAVAMNGVGVDVSVLSVHQSLPWLELPFGGTPGDHVDRLLSGRVGGSTPLSAALTIARERVRTGRGHEPLVFVVTDGAPNDEERYGAVLDACNFPVFGVYIDEGDGAAPDHAEFFDRLVVTDPDAVGTTLTQLVRTLFRQG